MPDDLKGVIAEALDLAKAAPDNLQEAVFNRAFDALRGADSPPPTARQLSRSTKPATRKTPPSEAGNQPGPATPVHELFDSTQHHEVIDATSMLDRCLWVIRIAKDEYGVDGLTPPEIVNVLTEAFRIPTVRQVVTPPLKAAARYVKREQAGRGYRYRIMRGGEDYLDAGGAKADTVKSSAPKPMRQSSSARKKTATAPTTTETNKPAPKKAKSSSKRPTQGRPGPSVAIADLITEGFFSTPRDMGAIQQQLQHRRGHRYKPTDLSPALVRALRSGKLDRERNKSGRYEYRAR